MVVGPFDEFAALERGAGADERDQAGFARSLGFFGKSAIHPRQLDVIHQVFTPTTEEILWARNVLNAFNAADQAALRLPSGEFVDLPVADRARRLLELATARPPTEAVSSTSVRNPHSAT